MKAIAVRPGTPNSVHLADIPMPELASIPNGLGVKVQVLQVGVDATDREINDGLYGNPPAGFDYLVLGHEVFGRVIEVGPAVRKVKPGDHVSCTVRRPGSSIYDQIGRNDITNDEVYYERGINLLHGFLTEYFVDHEEFIVRIPDSMKHIGVLAEPASVVAKGLEQAWLAQQRLQVWRPQTAWVLGAGQIGLLATIMLRLRGLDVITFARQPAPGNIKAEIVTATGAQYVSTAETSLTSISLSQKNQPDVIFEATGSSQTAFKAMQFLGRNGVLIWTSVTGGTHTASIPADQINLQWVLGNKLLLGTVNGNNRHFEIGITDMALAEAMYPCLLSRILTTRIPGLSHFAEAIQLLVNGKDLKIVVEVASND